MAISFLGNELNPFSKYNKAVVNVILLCTIIFVAQFILSHIPYANLLFQRLMFTPNLPEFLYQPWSIVTYIFLHAGFWHLFGNMLWLFFIGILLEDMLGKKHIWRLFIIGGIVGAILWGILFQIIWRGNDSPSYMVGASGGVTAVIVGTAAFAPRYRVYLFGILPIELIWIAFFRVLFDFFGMIGPYNTGGYTAHFGGALFGLFYMLHIKGNINIPLFDFLSKIKLFNQKKPVMKPIRSANVRINADTFSKTSRPNQEEIDRILDKINKSGYESLTKDEKETLFRAAD